MDKLVIPKSAAPFVEALRGLIRTGVLASPSLETSSLVELLVVQRRSGADSSPAKRADIFIKVLKQIVEHRLEGKDSTTARILFALGEYAGLPPQDRYRFAAKLYNRYWTWENFRKEPLTRFLLAVYLALEREAELIHPLIRSGDLPRSGSSGLIGQDWVLDSFEGVYTFPKKAGQWLEVLQTRKLRAICNEINVWRHAVYWRERGMSSTPSISLQGPGSVSITDSHLDKHSGIRVFITEVRFPTTIHYGESVEVTLIKRLEVKHERLFPYSGQDWFGLLRLSSPTEYARIGLRFPSGRQPRLIWRHEDIMNGLIRPSVPTKESLLYTDTSGYVECAWSELAVGMSYGIAFSW